MLNQCISAYEPAVMVRILIADDHEVVRSGLRATLEAQAGWSVVAEAANGKDAVAKAAQVVPDVAIVDYALPLINGIEVTRRIRIRNPETEVLIFTMHDSETLIREMLSAGARGYLLKSDATAFLITAVESLAAHKPFFTGKISETLLESFLVQGQHGDMLTGRERTVVQLIAEGYTNKEMADILSLSMKTIEAHRASALRKLELKNTAGLVRYAIRNKLVSP